ncbi:hypothetical protein [Microvirga massiliensis]|uniref:hypothetical protein n=1 Tax=Microvirga massiliensis TaxID=1033741 RepID=UPI00062BC4B3|nr:hypothetical protein [Microvirga massiliensis]
MKLKIEISDEQAQTIQRILDSVNDGREFPGTHGKLTIEGLIQMLLADVEMVHTRPGSWEGANMAQVLTSHGYEY